MTEDLVVGYARYTDAAELSASAAAQAPATITTAVLSTTPCGAAITSGVVATVHWGC